MALNETSKPEDVKTVPANGAAANNKTAPVNAPPENKGATPTPEVSGDKAAPTSNEGKEAKPSSDNTVIQPGNSNNITQKQVENQDDKSKLFQNEKKPDGVQETVKPPQDGEKKEAVAPVNNQAQTDKSAKTGPPVKTDGPDKKPPQGEKPATDNKTKNIPAADKPVKSDAPGKEPPGKPPVQTGVSDKKPPDGKTVIQGGINGKSAPNAQTPAKSTVLGGAGSKPPTTPQERTEAMAKAAIAKADVPPAPAEPSKPTKAPRNGNGTEKIVFISLAELHPFKNHPFAVRNDEEMKAMAASVKDKGVTNPAIVRPREDGGYEIVSGHRRQKASELAGFFEMPCIVRNLTDEQAITQMVEDNTNQREEILPSERAKALKMQLDAIKKQGSRDGVENGNGSGQRSNEIVAERNKMAIKQVQRYIKLNELVPELMKMVDEKKITFTPAVELAFISPKNQQYIAVAIEGQQAAPSLSQAQRMRELDQQNLLNPDMIDGIMLEDKKSKEANQVIISTQELSKYFGKDKTPRDMKDQIMKLLDEWAGKEKEIAKPDRKIEQEK